QFVWWLGHITVVYATIFYFLNLVFRQEINSVFYSKVFRGSIISYGIVIWKGHKPFSFSYSYLQTVLKDETSCYLLLAVYWLIATPTSITVIPFFVYSIFHCINYIRTRLFPAILPQAAEELKNYNQALKNRKEKKSNEQLPILPPEAQLVYKVQQVALEQYAPFMQIVAFFEVGVIPLYLLIGLFGFGYSIITIFVYSQFLMRRVKQSKPTIAAFTAIDKIIQSFLDHPPAPPAVKQFYSSLRSFFVSLKAE
ncbi:hypothetical protein K502DRAFT_289719, partial [Neoconidiobolus thromboides FSU 785]